MIDKKEFEEEALAEFLEVTGIPKERVDQYGEICRVEFQAYGETYELKNPGLVVIFKTFSDGFLPVLYFPKKHQDISEPVKDQLPCSDVISRKEAIDVIRQLYIDLATQKYVIDLLKVLPSVTPQETRKGCWVHGKELCKEYLGQRLVSVTYEDWHCSECHCVVEESIKPKWNYCPNCGAKMVEPQESEGES